MSRQKLGQSASDQQAVPASRYNYQELAEIYNEARTDYIVPMPMNAKRMQEYVEHYDIDLDGSFVVLGTDNLPCGVGMLGMRGHRAWVTRLGVIPHRRLRGMGQFIMESMLNYAQDNGATLAQLEVIVGNDPARALFLKLGFRDTRTLLIVRRPPGEPAIDEQHEAAHVENIPDDAIHDYLAERAAGASWIEETPSLLNAGNLRGIVATLPDGERAWVIFQRTPFQLTHFVLGPDASHNAIHAALYHVHKAFPMQDTKIENVPLKDEEWQIYKRMGYIEVFRRHEMFLYF